MDGNKTVTATFLEQYTLTVIEDGSGSVSLSPPGGIYTDSTVVTLTPVPDSGWVFDGWSGSDAGDLTDNSDGTWSITMESIKSITATFVELPPDQYALTVTDGGNGDVMLDPPGGIYTKGTVVSLKPEPDTGWAFDGWSGTDAGDLIDNNDGTWSITMDSDKIVNATFVEIPPEQYTLTVIEVGNGNVTLDPLGGTYDKDKVVRLEPEPDTGWVFNNWSGSDAGDLTDNSDGTWSISIDSNKSVIATFVELPLEQYTLTVIEVGYGSVELSPPGGIYKEGTVVTLTAIADPNWIFVGWNGDLNGTDNPTGMIIRGNASVIASFQELKITTFLPTIMGP